MVATPREGDAEQLAPAQLALGRYEAERPAEELAYRHGDIRFIAQPGREDD